MSAATLYSLPGPIRNALVSRWFPGLLVTTVLGPFYWLSAVTRVGGGDWGQFQTFGYMGGIAHPPGYPLIIGSINLATRVIRVDEPAHVANLVNATFATAAGVALFYAGWLLTHSRLAAALATLVFATGYSIWAQATQAGHISVQMLLVFLLVLALVAYDKRPTPTRLAAVAFAVGLSLTNHGLSVFMLPATALLVVIRRFPGISRPRTLLMAGAAGLVGMTPWLYVLRGLLVPVPANRPETIQRLSIGDLWHLIVGKPIVVVNESGVTSLSVEDRGTALLAEWPSFAHDVLREFGWFWIALSLVRLAGRGPRATTSGWLDSVDRSFYPLVRAGNSPASRQRSLFLRRLRATGGLPCSRNGRGTSGGCAPCGQIADETGSVSGACDRSGLPSCHWRARASAAHRPCAH